MSGITPTWQRKIVASLFSGLLIVSAAAGVIVFASESASAITIINNCTTITSAGEYVLGSDLHSNGHCIRIHGSDVTLDGRGHSIINEANAKSGVGIWIVKGSDFAASSPRDVTIQDVTVRGFGTGIAIQQTRDSEIRSSTATDNNDGILIEGERIRVIGNTVTDNDDTGIAARKTSHTIRGNAVHRNGNRGIYLRSSSTNTVVRNNTVTGHTGTFAGGAPGIVLNGFPQPVSSNIIESNILDANTVRILLVNRAEGNTIRLNHNGEGVRNKQASIKLEHADSNMVARNRFDNQFIVRKTADRNTIRQNRVPSILIDETMSNTIFDNDILGNLGVSVINSTNTLVLGNRITTGSGLFSRGVWIDRSNATMIRGNAIADKAQGIFVRESRQTDIEFNTIRDNAVGIRIHVGGAATTTIRGNNFIRNAQYGVQNLISEVVDARYNFWGASNGPSSPTDDSDAPFADPVTGQLADGNGDAVSESPTRAGVSNVHFHPWSETSAVARESSLLKPL